MSFDEALRGQLEESTGQIWPDNWDAWRFGPQSLRRRIKVGALKALWATPLRPVGRARFLHRAWRQTIPYLGHLEALFQLLADDLSRETLVKVWAYRMLGPAFVRLPLQSSAYWDEVGRWQSAADTSQALSIGFRGWTLPLFHVKAGTAGELPVSLHHTAKGIVTEFVLQQYRCVLDDGTAIEPGAGDTVVDGGACFGDTALLFANRVGASGRVLSFEFLPANLRVFHANLALNPELAARVDLLPHPLWSSPDVPLYVSGDGPGARVTVDKPGAAADPVRTETIDRAAQVANEGVDFIKLDIEGAELDALRGAERVLREDRPTLAIAAYHRPGDLWEIPAWVDSLGLGYRWYMRHFTIHAEETVLFGCASRPEGTPPPARETV